MFMYKPLKCGEIAKENPLPSFKHFHAGLNDVAQLEMSKMDEVILDCNPVLRRDGFAYCPHR